MGSREDIRIPFHLSASSGFCTPDGCASRSCRQSSGTLPESRGSALSASRASGPPWCPETGSTGRRQTWCRAQAEADVLRKHPDGVRTPLVTLPDTA